MSANDVILLPIPQRLLEVIGQGLTQLPYYLAQPAIQEINDIVTKAVNPQGLRPGVQKPGQEDPVIEPQKEGPAPGLALVDKTA